MRSPLVAAVILVAALAACKKSEPRKQAAEPAPAPTAAPAAPAATAPDPWAAPAPAPGSMPVIAKPFFYEATKDGHTLYLLGTMHLGIDAERQLPTWVLAKLDGARAFAMETDVSDPSVVKLLIRSDGKKLSDELSPEDWTKLKSVIGDNVAESMNTMKPFATLTTVAMKDLPMTSPMDAVLFQRAKAAGKPIVFLEEVSSQLAAIDPFATAADVHALLANLDHSRTQSLQMVKDYVAGDAAAINAMFEDQRLWLAAGRDPARFGDFVDATLRVRNQAWIAPLEQLAADGGGFVAVGAAHLIGPSNVPDLLAARGFSVRRMTAP